MTRFRVAAHPDLRILRFDDESVVFNPFLWHTHLLNPAAALILDALEDGPATADEIAAALADESGAPAIPADEVERVLGELAGLALIEPDALEAGDETR
jgi:PqqD family protein of HPr-rel-A system